MPVTLKQCPLALGSRTLAAWVVVVLAVSYSARSSQAGVIVGDDQSIGAMVSADTTQKRDSQPQALTFWSSFSAPPWGQTGSGFGSSTSLSNTTASSILAVFSAAGEPSLPELVSAVHGEGPLFFQPPPVFELLDPPKA